jgi:hypothetical protein
MALVLNTARRGYFTCSNDFYLPREKPYLDPAFQPVNLSFVVEEKEERVHCSTLLNPPPLQ